MPHSGVCIISVYKRTNEWGRYIGWFVIRRDCGNKNVRIYGCTKPLTDLYIDRQGLCSSFIQLEIQACFTAVFLNMRKTPVCSISLVIVKKIKESMGHMIRFFTVRAGRIARKPFQYSISSHSVLRITLTTRTTTSLAIRTLFSVSFLR